eukprot:SM009744S25171  [mRNA]  locus=s9744:70:442:+ [translate_table: standard]
MRVLVLQVTLDEVAPELLLEVIYQSCNPIPGLSLQISALRGLSDETQLHCLRWTQVVFLHHVSSHMVELQRGLVARQI